MHTSNGSDAAARRRGLVPDRGWPFALGCAVCAYLLVTRTWMPFATAAALIVLFHLLLLLATRRLGDPGLRTILVWCYYMRVGLALALYWISWGSFPILRSAQIGNGFWLFAPDSVGYDSVGRAVVEAWSTGGALPPDHGHAVYHLIVSLNYLVAGPHPLHAVLFNVAFGIASALLAYLIGRRLGGSRAGRLAAAIVGFWPSSVLWSTQILREAVTGLLVLSTLYLLVRAMQDSAAEHKGVASRGRLLLTLAASGVPTFLLGAGPALYALVLTMVAAVSCSVVGLLALWRGQVYRAVALTTVVVLMAAGTFAGRTSNLLYMFDPTGAGPRAAVPRAAAADGEAGQGGASARPGGPRSASADDEGAQGRADWDALRLLRFLVQAPMRAPALSRALVGAKGFVNQIAELPVTIVSLRRGQLSAAGATPIYPDLDLSSYGKIAGFLPRGFAYAMVAPLPHDAWKMGESSGVLRYLSIVEMLLIYALVPIAALSLARSARRVEFWLLAGYFVLGLAVLSLTIANLGSLFRYRVEFFLGVILVAAACRAPGRVAPAVEGTVPT